MGNYLERIPTDIQDHIRNITKSSSLPDNEESVETIAEAWLEKKRIFEEEIQKRGMEEIDDFGMEEDRGALMLTYSGSLLTLGPLVDGSRNVEYLSIGLRGDVPESAHHEHAKLSDDVAVDEVAAFSPGPVKQTSAIYKIAVASDELETEEEEELLAGVTEVLSEEFAQVNKTVILE
ncbi:MAG: hypothetical protein ACLFPV_06445 [Spirochaetaceae bacterium]